MNKFLHNQRGSAVILILATILVILLVAIAWKVATKEDAPKKTSDTTTQTASTEPVTDEEASQSATLSQNQRNTQRKNDASLLASAMEEHLSNNLGNVPTGFEDGRLISEDYSPEQAINFSFYSSATVTVGEQRALDIDDLVLVTGATCGENGATVEAASMRSYAIQYSLESANGRFTPACKTF